MKRLISHSFFIIIITIVITLFTSAFMEMWVFKIAFPEQSGLGDFEFEDFAFSTYETKEERDLNIILVNIGQLRRGEIADQINILNEFGPRVIGVNVLFNCEGFKDTINCPQLLDTLGNLKLRTAIKNAGNVVLVSKLLQSQQAVRENLNEDSLEYSDPEFSNFSRNGFANLVTSAANEGGIRSCRSFAPTWMIKNEVQNAFSVEICKLFDSAKTKRFLKRRNEEEIINYKGNVFIKGLQYQSGTEYYKTIEYEDVLQMNFDTTLVKDKIVILGYLGDYLLDNRVGDMFYSPLNRVVLGKSPPDMYGVVVHANIASMILNENYINRISRIHTILISMIIVFLNAMLFVWLHKRSTVWYEALTLLIPVSQIVIIAYLRHFLFLHLNHILDLSMATVLLVSVSLAAGLYFGPVNFLVKKFITKPA